jgi:hypothetical protein
MKKQWSPGRVGGLITVFICLVGVMLGRLHNVYLDVFCGCVALASLAISAAMQRRHAGFRR